MPDGLTSNTLSIEEELAYARERLPLAGLWGQRHWQNEIERREAEMIARKELRTA